jgi:hypothetical protein
MPPGWVGIIAAVPTSNTPHPQAQESAKPGTRRPVDAHRKGRIIRPREDDAGAVGTPRAEENEFMMPSTKKP